MITQGMCTSFKVGLLNGEFDFGVGTTQVYKLALYTSTADLSKDTTTYTISGEVVGTGYVAGGQALTIFQVPTSSGSTAFCNFSDVSWPSSTIAANGALIYLADGVNNPAVAVLDFGATKTSTNSTFMVNFPVATASNAILRIE